MERWLNRWTLLAARHQEQGVGWRCGFLPAGGRERGAAVGGLDAMSAEPWVDASSLEKDSELAIFQLCNWDMRAAGSGKRPVG